MHSAGAAAGGVGGAAVGGVAGYSRDPIRVDEWRPDISLSTTARDYALEYNATIRRARCDAGWTLEFAVPLVAALDSPVRLASRFLSFCYLSFSLFLVPVFITCTLIKL